MKPGLHRFAKVAALTVTALGSLAASGAAPALECNAVVTEAVTLTEDIVCRNVGDTGITVAAGNVTIDLNGHTISGFKKENSVGIRVIDGVGGVAIANGTIEFFERGIVIRDASDVDVTNVTSRGNRKDGILVLNGIDVGLVNNELRDNANGIVIQGGDNLRLLNNQGKGNTEVSFDVSVATDVSLTNNASSGGAVRAAFRTVGPATVRFTENQAKSFKGFGFQFADAPSVTDGGGNKANGKPSKACFPDPCPLSLK
jgi:hypothetical protein